MKTFYFDTSVWLDFHEARGRRGERALSLIMKIIKEDVKIAYSDLHIREFKNLGYSQKMINSIFEIIKPDNIERVHIHRKNVEEARKLSRQRDVPLNDALHAIVCRDNYFQLISRDRHYESLKDVATAKLPEEFI